LHINDLPPGLTFGDSVAIDSEAMGLQPHRDRLCVVQMSRGDGDCHMVHFPPPGDYSAPNLKAILGDPNMLKMFHFARFDVAILEHYLGVTCKPIYCTKIASKLARTYTDRHGLKDLCRELLGIDMSKQQQSSDWGAAELTPEQQAYAASDVLYLHEIKTILDAMLGREGRTELAQACFDFLPHRAWLDLIGWDEVDIFHH
jgi:ribonuclease D